MPSERWFARVQSRRYVPSRRSLVVTVARSPASTSGPSSLKPRGPLTTRLWASSPRLVMLNFTGPGFTTLR